MQCCDVSKYKPFILARQDVTRALRAAIEAVVCQVAFIKCLSFLLRLLKFASQETNMKAFSSGVYKFNAMYVVAKPKSWWFFGEQKLRSVVEF